jgi:hypothetical protein
VEQSSSGSHRPTVPVSARQLSALQRQVGNRAVQRLVASSSLPVAPREVAPQDDPRFAATADSIGQVGASQKAHPPASAKVAEAQAAAEPPGNEVAAQAGASQLAAMNDAKAGSFDKAAFIAAVGKAIDAASPRNLDEADNLKDSGRAAEVKQQVSGQVTQGKDDSARDIKSATQAAPDTSAASQKPVTPMPAEQAGQAPTAPAADGAVPAPRGDEQVNLDQGPRDVNEKMADAKVTDQQLAKGNEPQFSQALDSKGKLEQYAATAPGQVRAAESQQLAAANAGATGAVAAGVAGMHAARGTALSGVGGHKGDAKAADEAKRAEISKHIEDIFAATKTDVTALLDGLDQQVGKAFDDGEKTARDTFNSNLGAEMTAWKDKRYSGISGAAQWLADKFTGAPPEVDQIFARNRAKYVADMQQVISTIADIVGTTLTKAKQRIADGRGQVNAYVASQPAALRQVAAEASGKIDGQFTALEGDVTAKQDAIVSDLAQKYVAARKSVDDEITKMQAENKGYVEEAESAVEGAIETIEKLRDWIEHTAQRIANSVDKILADPITFVGKLLTAVKTGFSNFMSNIGEHLKQGFKEFLFGALAEAGIQLPETFDLKGIFQLVLNVFGITYEHVKARVLQKLGPKAAKIWHLIEEGITIIQTLRDKGIAGIWEMVLEKIQGIKDLVIDGIKSFIVDTVVKKGVEWLLSLFNPAGAFVEAVELIIDVVQFFIQKGKQIQETVDRILDSVESLLGGGEGGVPALIEQTLAKAVPTVITFLADLVGLGDLGTTLQGLVKKAQSMTDSAIDWLVDKAVALVKSAWAALSGKDKAKDKAPGEESAEDFKNVKFSVSFQVDGEAHTVFTNPGEPRILYTASDPKPASEAVQDPEVTSLDDQFKSLMSQYWDIASQLQGTPNDTNLMSQARKLKKQAEAILQKIVTLTIADMKKDSPGRHAPGIGQAGPHGKQTSRLRPQDKGKEVPAWRMESEHLIPRELISAFFSILPVPGSEISNAEYKAMVTILMYADASKIKTTTGGVGDLASIHAMKSDVRDRMVKALNSGQPVSAGLADLGANVIKQLDERGQDSLNRAADAVVTEQGQVGDARGQGAEPRPNKSEMIAAYNAQQGQVVDFWNERLKKTDEIRKSDLESE